MAVQTDTRLEQELRRAARRFEQGREHRDEVIRRAAAEGYSLRRIGRLIGLSHQRVDQIVRGSRV